MNGFLENTASRKGRGLARHAAVLLSVALAYFVLAKLGLRLASINPSASPIWPPSGFALAAVLLWGRRVWPAIFVGALAANVTTAGTLATSLAIALGNTLEAVAGGLMIARWSDAHDTFASPARVAKFAAVSVGPASVISASVGLVTLCLAGLARWADFSPIWVTWWLGDAAGMLVATPAIVLWARSGWRPLQRGAWLGAGAVFACAIAVGLVAFSPLLPRSEYTTPLGFLAIMPLVWAALRRGPRDTATVSLIMTGFAIWAAAEQAGPFAQLGINGSFLVLLTFIVSLSVPSLVLSADVAARRHSEEGLRASQSELDRRVQERTAALADANIHLMEAQRLANLGSWSWDIAQNRIAWSEQLRDIYGVTPDNAPSRVEDFVGFLHPDDRARVQASIAAALERGGDFSHEERILRPDGDVRHLQSTGEVVCDESGRPIRMLGVCLDVTERVRAEGALERTREQLAQAQKMEALGQLTGGIAHDFNNLLMIVSGYAQILQRRLTQAKDVQAVDAIRAATNRGERLTRQLLAFSRRQQLTPVVVDLRARIGAVREMLAPSLHGSIGFVTDIEDGLWKVEADLGELELALVNMAVNARDAMPDGGAITLQARNVALGAGSVAIPLQGDFVALAVIDTGAGIAPEVLPRVFEPFFTTKPVGKGTGLGLSQVHGFANQSGGAVTVTSEPGKGTAVTIYLPRSRGVLAAEADKVATPTDGQAHGMVLLVEDSHEVADVTATMVEQLGYRVVRAQNAAEALRHLEQGGEADLVFSDIVMPGTMNGIALAEACAERFPDTAVLLTTGFTDATEPTGGRCEILRKPFELATLQRAIEAALRARRAERKRAG